VFRIILLLLFLLVPSTITHLDKNPPRVPVHSGCSWVMETLKTPGGSRKIFRMNASLFYKLHDLLVSNYGLKSPVNMSSIEALAIFLATCGHGWSNSALHGIFKHSGETLSRKLTEVLNYVMPMCAHYIRPVDPNFSNTHARMTGDNRMMPFSKIAFELLMVLTSQWCHLLMILFDTLEEVIKQLKIFLQWLILI
jgi:hypothetical protein